MTRPTAQGSAWSIRLNQTQSWGDPFTEEATETLEGSQGMKQAVIQFAQPASACSPGLAASTMDSTGPGFDISRSVRATLIDATSSEHDGPESPSTTTFDPYNQTEQALPALRSGKGGGSHDTRPLIFEGFDHYNLLSTGNQAHTVQAANGGNNQPLIFSAAGSPAKTSQSPDSAEDSTATDPDCSSSSPGSQTLFDPDGFSSRTYPVSSLATAVGTSEQSLERWPISGTAWPGGFSTHVTSECRSDAGGCSSWEPSLTEILEPPQNVPARYSLSARAARGILRRAQKRGRILPTHLRTALERVT